MSTVVAETWYNSLLLSALLAKASPDLEVDEVNVGDTTHLYVQLALSP